MLGGVTTKNIRNFGYALIILARQCSKNFGIALDLFVILPLIMNTRQHPLVELVADAIRRRGLISGTGVCVVGLSGGADSVALTAVLTELGYVCVALHVNYGLRGDESLRDERHAVAVARKLGVEVVVERCSPEKRPGVSVEMACRDIRYERMEALRRERRAEAVAVAHHREDQAETFFLNLLRGSGPAGLRGMKWRRDNIIRPMLGASREMIEDYLRSKELTWVDDSSNAADDYQRNRVRHGVMPALEAVRADALGGVLRSMEYLAEADALLSNLAAERRERYSRPDGALDVRALSSAESYPESMLYLMLAPEGFHRSVTDAIVAAAHEPDSRIFRTAQGDEWEMTAGLLRAVRVGPLPVAVRGALSDMPLIIEEISPDEFAPRRDPSVIYMDADKAAGGVWEMRGWRDGDRMRPFGMRGSRPVSDILADAGVVPSQRARQRVLTRDGEMIWVVGVRASAHFAVTSSTRRILRLTVPRKPG